MNDNKKNLHLVLSYLTSEKQKLKKNLKDAKETKHFI
jgi:hypothetical protein